MPVRISALAFHGAAAILLAVAALAQTEPLGPHNMGSIGCSACHPPARIALSETLFSPSQNAPLLTADAGIAADEPVFHSFVCLTCHDGSLASLQMLGSASRPRPTSYQPFLSLGGNDQSHPVDIPYRPNDGCIFESPNCDPAHWPSRVDPQGLLTWQPPRGPKAVAYSYGHPTRFFPTPDDGGQAMIECSTCHNPHSVSVARQRLQGTVQEKPSRAFVRGWYETGGRSSNTVSKFCRSCHYDKADAFADIRE